MKDSSRIPTQATGLSRRQYLSAAAIAAFAPWRGQLGAARGQADIRLGACCPVRELDTLARLGFDYIEPGAAEIAAMSADEFARFKDQVFASPIRCEAFNSLIRRKDLVVVGPAVDLNPVLDYLETTLGRCKQLGARSIVWGSAGSRNVPDGFPREQAWDQIAQFLSRAAPLAAKFNLPLSIEPLNHRESNIFNTGHEAWRMVQQVNHPNIQLMIDYYHLTVEHESLDILEAARGHITHLHFSQPTGQGRIWPAVNEADPNAEPFFSRLKQVGWSGGLSIEGAGSPSTDGSSALAYLRAHTS